MAKWRYQKGPMGNSQQDVPRTWEEETGSDSWKDSWGKRKGELHQPKKKKPGWLEKRVRRM